MGGKCAWGCVQGEMGEDAVECIEGMVNSTANNLLLLLLLLICTHVAKERRHGTSDAHAAGNIGRQTLTFAW